MPKYSPPVAGERAAHKGRVFRRTLVLHHSFQASGRPNPPSPLMGEGGEGDKEQKASGREKHPSHLKNATPVSTGDEMRFSNPTTTTARDTREHGG